MSNTNDDAYMHQDDDIEMDVAGSDDEEVIDEEGSEGDEEEGDVSEEDIMNDQADDDVEPPPPAEEDAAIARRRAIQAIMRDTTLSEQDKRQRIQDLMSGGRTYVAPPPAPILPAPDANAACVHYERNCNIVSPCCNRVVGCRICHDELSPAGHPPMNRFMIREVVCKNCNTRQPTSYDPTVVCYLMIAGVFSFSLFVCFLNDCSSLLSQQPVHELPDGVRGVPLQRLQLVDVHVEEALPLRLVRLLPRRRRRGLPALQRVLHVHLRHRL
jgi:uncharacterized CHY-type Zn-finger protein